ncbi:hypothetical protein Lal_00024314 [Lupinus albus]|nr:hypothetical protein Lal_00024314 [Lupinus albus]
MWAVRGSQSPLPCATFITNILKHFNVSNVGETMVALNLRESNIDVEVVNKMSFSIDPHDRRTDKHRTDRPTAPALNQNLPIITLLSFMLILPHMLLCLPIK